MANFIIKYLDSYPVYDFYESFELPEAILTDYKYDISKTDRLYGHVYDSNKEERKIQSIVYEEYTVEDIVGMNLDFYRLAAANHVLVETEDGDSFNAVNFSVVYEDTDNSRDSKVTIKFYKPIETLQPLSSDYAESIHSDIAVNRLRFVIKNPPYVQNTDMRWTGTTYDFKFTIDDLTDNIVLNDYLYAHVTDPDFDNETHYYVKCTAKSASQLTFTFISAGASTAVQNTEVVLDYEPDITTTGNVTDDQLTLNLYTFLNPIYSNILTPKEGANLGAGIKENQGFNSKKQASLRFWVTDDELYKIEYLNYALFDDVSLILADTTIIYPIQTEGILTPINKESLLSLHEFEINILYLNKEVNIYR